MPTCAATQSFSASSIEFDWTSLDATPTVISFRSAGTLTMQAKAIHAETEALHMAELGPGGGVVTNPPKTTSTTYGASTWHADTSQSPQSLFIVGNQTKISARQGYGTALVPVLDCVNQPDYYASPRPSLCPEVHESVQVKGTAAEWVITGNFTLVLWSWDGTVIHETKETLFWTGARATEPNAFGLGDYEYRQLYLKVTQGTLWLQPSQDQALDLYASGLDAVVEQATFRGQSEGDVQGGVEAHSRIQVSRTAEILHGRVDEVLSPQVQTAGFARRDWSIGALGVAGLLLPVGAVLVRSNQGLRHLSLANDNLELENHRAAARHAKKAAKIRRLRARAGLVGAIACIRYGDLEGAEHFIGRMHASPRHDEAGCRFLLAHVRVEQDLREEGQVLLEECLRINPSYLEEAAGSPVLGPFIDPMKWPRSS